MADDFGNLLKQLREAAGGLSQQALAESCGVPVTTLRNWEQGRRRPDLGSAYRLAKALGVPLDTLGEAAAKYPLRGAGGVTDGQPKKPMPKKPTPKRAK